MRSLMILSCVISVAIAAELDFTYADQQAWPMLPQSQCGGKRQSPINLDLNQAVVNPNLGQQFACTWQRHGAIFGGQITNTGRTIEMEVDTSHVCRGVPGVEASEFRLAKVHIHYGTRTGEGSEHTINGRASDLEMHLVHFDTRFKDLDQAALNPNGIMVTAILFDEAQESFSNCGLSRMAVLSATALQQIKTKTSFHLSAGSLIAGTGLQLRQPQFATYAGSLTTPTCNEVVTWVVASQTGRVGSQTLQMLRAAPGLKPGTKLAPNFRQLQQLNGRKVTTSFKQAQPQQLVGHK